MTEQSIDSRRRTFDEWRLTKLHRTEGIPDNVPKRARELIPVLGVSGIAVWATPAFNAQYCSANGKKIQSPKVDPSCCDPFWDLNCINAHSVPSVRSAGGSNYLKSTGSISRNSAMGRCLPKKLPNFVLNLNF